MASNHNPRRGYLGRLLILTMGAAAIGCSVLCSLSCDFLGVGNVVVSGGAFPDEPYLQSFGLWYYDSAAREGCIGFGTDILNSNFNEFFIAAQIASLIAPVLGLTAFAMVLSELLIAGCRFNGSFLMQNLLYLFAFFFQSSTFLVLGQTDFCVWDKVFHCKWQLGSILSMTAAALFYISSILLCCLPRPNPFLSSGADDDDDESYDDSKVEQGDV